MPELNVLLTSSGRRVELLDLLRSALKLSGCTGRVVAADAGATSPAALLADAAVRLPRIGDQDYGGALLEAVRAQGIGLVVPTIDTELAALAALRGELAAAGARVLVSGPGTVDIAGDKVRTAAHLRAHDLPAPRQWAAEAARAAAADLPYPVIAKPAFGSASVGVRVVPDAAGLLAGLGNDDIVQELVVGAEFTVDVWVEDGVSVCAVPRRRLEVRAGEVSKGVTERDPSVIRLSEEVVRSLPDADGPLTIQIVRATSGPVVLEVNARLGGGYPLSVEAGAPTLVWAIQRALGRRRDPERFDWEPRVLMLRHDRSVFVRGWEDGA